MTGQRHDDIDSMVVLALDSSGQQIGWHVFNVEEAAWDFAGVGDQGARATVTVTGDFHRIARGSPAFGAFDGHLSELEGGS